MKKKALKTRKHSPHTQKGRGDPPVKKPAPTSSDLNGNGQSCNQVNITLVAPIVESKPLPVYEAASDRKWSLGNNLAMCAIIMAVILFLLGFMYTLGKDIESAKHPNTWVHPYRSHPQDDPTHVPPEVSPEDSWVWDDRVLKSRKRP